IFRNFRTWKRYEGGMAQDVYIYDFKNKKSERITDWKGTDSFPMWHGDKIFFTSDRDANHRLNIYNYDLNTKETKQVTFFKDYDVMWPSMGGDNIVFENGGYLYLLGSDGGEPRKLTIMVPGDQILTQPKW